MSESALTENSLESVHIEEKIRKLLLEKPQRDPYKRFTILGYQLADVGRCMRYMEIYPDDRDTYRTFLKTSVADLIIQTLIIAKLYEFSAKELVNLGTERLEEFKQKGRYFEPD